MRLHTHPSPVPAVDSDRDDWWRHARCATGGRAERDTWTSDNLDVRLAAAHMCIAHCPVLARCHKEAQGYDWPGVTVGGVVYGRDGQRLDLEPPLCVACRRPTPVAVRVVRIPPAGPRSWLALCERCGGEYVTDRPTRRYCTECGWAGRRS